MRIAILSDLHSNQSALQACLNHAVKHAPDRFAFLGDLVGYGAHPVWVVEQVMGLVAEGNVCIQGNHDLYACHPPDPSLRSEVIEALNWTHQQLRPEQRQFLYDLPVSLQLEEVSLFHANAWAPQDWAYVVGKPEAAAHLRAAPGAISCCGHVHIPMLAHADPDDVVALHPISYGEWLPLSRRARWLLNPGSVGQPRDGNPAASYLVLDTSSYRVIFERPSYDIAAAANAILQAGLPRSFAERLYRGQ